MGIRVLIVDDEQAVRKGVRRILERAHIDVVGEASEGAEAVDLVRETHPDLVIMDITMPGMNGIDATREIKRKNPATKIVILTGHNERAYVRAARDTGADAFLVKKSVIRQLLSTIRGLTANRASA